MSMKDARALMKQAHQLNQTAPRETKEPVTPIKQEMESARQVREESTAIVESDPGRDHLPTEIKRLIREDVHSDVYSINRLKSSFGLYNYEIDRFASEFSRQNQRAGGSPITKSDLIEVILDIMYYDIGLRPIGFESPQAMREYLQEKCRIR